jgi:hypothetical protein
MLLASLRPAQQQHWCSQWWSQNLELLLKQLCCQVLLQHHPLWQSSVLLQRQVLSWQASVGAG